MMQISVNRPAQIEIPRADLVTEVRNILAKWPPFHLQRYPTPVPAYRLKG
jgi:hypothetical protein